MGVNQFRQNAAFGIGSRLQNLNSGGIGKGSHVDPLMIGCG
jgi:hypothetical protein